MSRKVNVLFVCRGNICRPPTAELVLKDLLSKRRGFAGKVLVDSCGTHAAIEGTVGTEMHPTSASVLGEEYGDIGQSDHSPSQMNVADFRWANIIVCMDMANRGDVIAFMRGNKIPIGKKHDRSVKLLTGSRGSISIEDPYGKPKKVFQSVLGRISGGCRMLTEEVASRLDVPG